MALCGTGEEILAILREFGVPNPEQCRRVVLDIPAGDAVLVTVEYYPSKEQLESGIRSILAQYHLAPNDVVQ